MKGYPVFLIDLDGRRSVVVGGNGEAERKVEGLLECDAAVTVIASRVTGRIRSLAEAGALTWVPRDYREGDLAGAFLVIVAGGEAPSERIRAEARAERALINVMDDTERCDFIAGSVVRRGPLTVAISTSGAAPAFAVRLRERLERDLGPEYGTFLELMATLRGPIAERHPDFEKRRSLWYELIDSDVIDHVRAGRVELARERAERIIADTNGKLRKPRAS